MGITLHNKWVVALLLGLSLAYGPALADKPEKENRGKSGNKANESHYSESHRGNDKKRDRDDDDSDRRNNSGKAGKYEHFNDHQRTALHTYYAEQSHKGHCPPGLAKKHNGCQPPGLAKKWRKGYALPKDVRYYQLPPNVLINLGPPPTGHKYVRVASDILMIAIGTSMVVDAIEDLGR